MSTTDIFIVGGGPAGLSAAIYAGRAGFSTVVLEKMFAGGQMNTTPEIQNYPGFAEITGMELSEKMRLHAENAGARFITGEAASFHFAPMAHEVRTQTEVFRGKTLILALGAKRRTLDCPGEAAFQGRGVSYCATCDGAFFKGMDVAVVGGGNTALEDALYLAALCRTVTLIHRREGFRGGAALLARVKNTPNIVLRLNSVVRSIEGGAKAERLILSAGPEVPVSAVFIAVGTLPDTASLAGQPVLDADGFLQAGEDCKTAISGVFAAGDVRKKPLYQIATAVGDGAVAATMAVRYLQEG